MNIPVSEINELIDESINGINVEKNQQIILDSKEPVYITSFAASVRGANIDKLQEAILQLPSNGEDYYYFALEVAGADINKLQKALIKSKNLYYILYFAKNIDGANIELLSEEILKSNNIIFIKHFYDMIDKRKYNSSKFETYFVFR